MGSSLSIHNNTEHPVFIKVGLDEFAALNISFIDATSIIAIAGILEGDGIDANITTITGILESVGNEDVRLLASAAAAGPVSPVLVTKIDRELKNKGYVKLESKQFLVFKETLSLWRQCSVVRILYIDEEIDCEELPMRSIFSAFRTQSSPSRPYSIAYWAGVKSRWTTKNVTMVYEGRHHRSTRHNRRIFSRPDSVPVHSLSQ